MEEVAKDDFELRVLRIPALYVMAFWLHGEKKDILVPMPPTNSRLNPTRPIRQNSSSAACAAK